MAQHTVKNITAGPRGFNATSGYVELAAGKTATNVEISEAELRSMYRTGSFQIDGGTQPSPGDAATVGASVTGTLNASGYSTTPFVPKLNVPIWLTVKGNFKGGRVALVRSVDGGATKQAIGVSAEGYPLTSVYTGDPDGVSIQSVSETSDRAEYYVRGDFTSGSATFEIHQ